MLRSYAGAALLLGGAVSSSAVMAQNISVELVAQGFVLPGFVSAPSGDDRLFMVDFPGQIWVRGPTGTSDLFLDISDLIGWDNAVGYLQTGLVGLAFHPDYAQNGRLFVSYNDSRSTAHIEEYRVSSDPNRADLSSRIEILSFEQENNVHVGGWIGFGPDGYLYMTTGDSSWANGAALYAQDSQRLSGKVLRIDIDGDRPYEIPASNPFVLGGGEPEVFALGLRNPWRASFDGGNLYIGDVGQHNREEVNVLATADAGANFGWSLMEGSLCFRRGCDSAELTMPYFEYSHRLASGGPPGSGEYGELACDSAIVGGYVYRGRALPELFGRYVYADFCTGSIRSLHLADSGATEARSLSEDIGRFPGITSFGVDGAGELYFTVSEGLEEYIGLLGAVGGLIFKIVPQ